MREMHEVRKTRPCGTGQTPSHESLTFIGVLL